MADRTIEVMVTFVVKVPDERLLQVQLDSLQDGVDGMGHPWYINRVTQKDGRKVLLRLDYKRPQGV